MQAANAQESSVPPASSAVCETGIYILGNISDRSIMQRITMQAGEKRRLSNLGGFMVANTFGASLKSKAVLAGPRAVVRTQTKTPEFKFCFALPETLLTRAEAEAKSVDSSYIGSGRSAETPRDFVLVRLEARSKTREVVISRTSIVGSSGALSDSSIRFVSLPVSPSVFSVKLDAELAPGEYAFFRNLPLSKDSAPRDQFFDFAIDSTVPPK
jgi:hypothetical protein